MEKTNIIKKQMNLEIITITPPGSPRRIPRVCTPIKLKKIHNVLPITPSLPFDLIDEELFINLQDPDMEMFPLSGADLVLLLDNKSE